LAATAGWFSQLIALVALSPAAPAAANARTASMVSPGSM